MTQPREWRDEQGRKLQRSRILGAELKFYSEERMLMCYLTEDDARFLLRVLPEALGLDSMGHEWSGPMGCCHRCGVLPDQPLGKQLCGDAGLDRAIVEAAERLVDNIAGQPPMVELIEAVEAKRGTGK